jgi:hypothetical protein
MIMPKWKGTSASQAIQIAAPVAVHNFNPYPLTQNYWNIPGVRPGVGLSVREKVDG